jgi:hypothetical protein
MVERREDDGTMERILKSVAWQVEHFAELPVLVVACLRGSKVPYLPMLAVAESSYYGSIYPSVQNLLLAARAMGLGASLITLPLWSVTAARSILGLPLSVQPCCIVAPWMAQGALRADHPQAGQRGRPPRPVREPALALITCGVNRDDRSPGHRRGRRRRGVAPILTRCATALQSGHHVRAPATR